MVRPSLPSITHNTDLTLSGPLSLEMLVSLPYRDFGSAEARLVTYPLSALLVRYLLEAHGAAFRAFLAAVAAGGAESLDLADGMCLDWPAFEKGFHAWLPSLWLQP
jgi:hypothetical protein